MSEPYAPYGSPPTPHPAKLYDALDGAGVVIYACMPVGMVSNMHWEDRERFILPFGIQRVAETLQCSKERFCLEFQRTGSLYEAFALILEEKVRGGVFAFSDLLVSYSFGEDAEKLLIAPTAERACIAILESKPAAPVCRVKPCAHFDTKKQGETQP